MTAEFLHLSYSPIEGYSSLADFIWQQQNRFMLLKPQKKKKKMLRWKEIQFQLLSQSGRTRKDRPSSNQ
jgi:hypothetical protein